MIKNKCITTKQRGILDKGKKPMKEEQNSQEKTSPQKEKEHKKRIASKL